MANLCGRRKALIMPAFETSKALTLERGREVADSAIQGECGSSGKLALAGLLLLCMRWWHLHLGLLDVAAAAATTTTVRGLMPD